MIAIQADLLELNGSFIMNFSKILDIYVEPEDDETATSATETTWAEKAKWTLNTAHKLFNIISEYSKNTAINYTQSYICITVDGKNAYMFDKRTNPNSVLWFNIKEDEKEESIKNYLEKNNIVYNFNNKYRDFSFTIDARFFDSNKETMSEIHKIKFKELSAED